MKTLIIYAHPNTGGHCEAILRETKSYLEQNKSEFEVLDLYAMNYDPVLHETEHYTRGKRNISPQTAEIQKKIMDSSHLIFIYPVWWGTMPAILKGFFDKTLTPHYAYKYVNMIPIGMLKDKKALVFLTTGAVTLLSSIFQGRRPINAIKIDILGFCGVKTKVCQLGNSLAFDDKRDALIKKVVPKELKKFY